MNTNTSIQDPFDSAFNSAGSNDGVYLLPGSYDLEIVATKLIKSSNPSQNGAVMFVVESKIVASTVPERPVGSSVSWICNFRHPSAKSSVRGFMARALGVAHEAVTDDVARGLVSAAQPLEGTLMRAIATQVPTRAGKEFTKVSWTLIKKSEKLAKLAG